MRALIIILSLYAIVGCSKVDQAVVVYEDKEMMPEVPPTTFTELFSSRGGMKKVLANGPSHDDLIYFSTHAVDTDFPILMYELSTMEDPERAPDGSIAYVCTRIHCVDALKHVTGANAGFLYSDWAAWYKKNYQDEIPAWTPGQALPEMKVKFNAKLTQPTH